MKHDLIKKTLETLGQLQRQAHDLQSDLYNFKHDIEDGPFSSPEYETILENVDLAVFNVGDVLEPIKSVISEMKSKLSE